MRKEVFGPRHPRVAQSMAQLAEVLHAADRLEDAEPLFEESLSIFEEHLPEGHPSFGRVWLGLGRMRLDGGDLDGARQALGEARAVYAGQEDSIWAWRLDVLLAAIDRRQGRPAEAAARLAAAEERLRDDAEWSRRWREEKAKLAAD